MTKIFIDADACPVKDETYRVSARHGLKVFVVANQWLKLPALAHVEMVVVDGGFDAADLWIVEQLSAGDIVITADLLLADLCIKKSARVLTPKGHELNEENIGSALAMRKLMENLRQTGAMAGGPKPFSKGDRSEFLSELERLIQAEKRRTKPNVKD